MNSRTSGYEFKDLSLETQRPLFACSWTPRFKGRLILDSRQLGYHLGYCRTPVARKIRRCWKWWHPFELRYRYCRNTKFSFFEQNIQKTPSLHISFRPPPPRLPSQQFVGVAVSTVLYTSENLKIIKFFNLILRICKLVKRRPKCVKRVIREYSSEEDDDELVYSPGNK